MSKAEAERLKLRGTEQGKANHAEQLLHDSESNRFCSE